MIGNWQIAHLSTPQLFFEYSRAYHKAAVDVCTRIQTSEVERTWSNAAVVNMLAAHSVELFLKAMILHRDHEFRVNSHDIDYLVREFKKRFPGPEFQVEFPFETIFLGVFTEEEKMESKGSTPSVLYRYPVNSNMVPWNEICSIDPQEFGNLLTEWNSEMMRLAEHAGLAI